MIKGGLPKGIKCSGERLTNWKRFLGLFRERMSLQKPLSEKNGLSAAINVLQGLKQNGSPAGPVLPLAVSSSEGSFDHDHAAISRFLYRFFIAITSGVLQEKRP